MTISQRKERQKQEMEKLILDSAMKLFLKEGYANVSIRKIADAIEYSPTTIYLYFKDKVEILYHLQNIAFDKFYQVQKSIQSIEDPLARLKAHGIEYIKFARENQEYYDLMFIMKEPLSALKCPNDWRKGNNSYNLLKENVKSCIEAGIIQNTDVESASFALWAFVHGISSLIIKRGMIIPDEYVNYLINGAFEFFFHNIKV